MGERPFEVVRLSAGLGKRDFEKPLLLSEGGSSTI